MVILTLAAMLIGSGIISIGAVQPVLVAFGLFVALYLVYTVGCMLPGYVRTRTASAMAASRVPSPPAATIMRSGLPVTR
jgi:hypothetical protein